MLRGWFNNRSIRLRLTLIYSVILGLTLIIFGIVVFLTQVRITLDETEQALTRRADTIAEFIQQPPPIDLPQPPDRFRNNANLQFRDLDGNIVDHAFSFSAIELPLSPDGLQAVQQGEVWTDIEETELGLLLVHSQLVSDEDDVPLIMQLSHSLEDRRQFLETMRSILWISGAIAVAVAFGIGWLLAGWTLRPINRISQTARTIGEERDFDQRVDYNGPNDEIGHLVTTFNGMLTELQAAFMEKDHALQVQQRFVADASHELRTPLTTIRGNLDLLQRHPPIDADDRAEILDDMVDETERLMRLVNDLLVLARSDTKRAFQREAVSIKPLVQELCHRYQTLAPSRAIVCDCLADLTALGDLDALKQVLIIILDNAVKHTASEAAITLTSAAIDQQVVITVSDNGPGIESEHLAHIFERFYRVDSARTGTGAGLGLAIAKELVEGQMGTLTVDSCIGQGTTFTIMLPPFATAFASEDGVDHVQESTLTPQPFDS